MKINHPVTDREVMMKPGTILVTHTNLKGIITYTNDDFVEISGFTRDELIGSNHNVVRHPDMPPEAFEDLWDTLKAGKPWVNLVKNRCKSGDYYWVEANVTPIIEKGQTVGYLSVRYSPSREQIRHAETLYENVRNKKAKIKEVTLIDKINFVKKFSLSGKISFIAVLLLIPTILLLGLFNNEKKINIEFAEKEISGIEYLNKLNNLSVNIINYRRSVDGSGDSTVNSLSLEKPISESINELDDLFTKSGLFLSTENNTWGAVKTAWSDLKSFNEDNDRKFSRVSEIIDDLNATVVQVADASNLSLDPDVDSYYLMTVSTTALPELLDRVGRLQSSGIKAFKNGRELDDKSKIDLAVYTQSSKKRAELVKNNLTIAFSNNPVLKASLLSQYNDYEQSLNNFFNTFSQDIYHPENSASSPQQILDKGIALNQSISRFSNSVNNELKNLLQKRIDSFNQDRLIKLVAVILLLLIVFFIGYYVVRYIISTINNVNNVLNKLGEGDFKNKIDLEGEDELAVLRRYLQSTQVKLNADVSNAREQAIKATRIMQALDNVQSCVMMADNNLDIIFMNKSILEMFRNAQDDIRTELPNFDINKLLGANIDQFHKNPAHQRGLLSNLKSTFSSNLVVGGRHLSIVANPVTNETGEKLGVVVEWTDRTREVKVEQEIEEIVDSVKIGRLDKRLSLADKQGFFAKLSEGINELTDVIERVFKDVGSTMESMSEGDLTNRITSDYQGVYLNCKNDINATIDKLSEIFSQVNESANFINNSSQEIASGNNNLSQRAEQQAANLEETAASMEELTSTVKNNADNAQQANLVASNARELAEKGGNVVTAAVAAMQEINESSNKIADIISVIDEIAFQTNLLALNASVEAARAGEQGRGFSVVATEVRNLAQRSATAARESKELIQSSVQKVRSGSEFVNQTGAALNEIVAGVKKVGDIVAGIAEASVEQSAGIAQVNQAVSQMDEITQQNAALAEEASAASVSMSDLSTNMVELLSFFKLENANNNRAAENRNNQPRAAVSAASASKSNALTTVARQATYKSSASEEEWQDF